MPLHKQVLIFALLCLVIATGCSGKDDPSRVPSDFVFVMDVRGAKDDMPGNVHVNIRIDAKGKGRFEYYDSGSSIRYDLNDMVTYEASQIVKAGKFRLAHEKHERLWDLLNENYFFELEEHYQMALGHSFAFIMVEANGKRYLVNNIGMQVPEIKAIVEATRTILPPEIDFEYGEGFTP